MQARNSVEFCRVCGGDCCKGCYLPAVLDDPIKRTEVIQFTKAYFADPLADERPEPFFKPFYDMGEDRYRELKDWGIDIRNCEYLSSNGCIIPRLFRPEYCNDYQCKGLRIFMETGDVYYQYMGMIDDEAL
jgi:hypothetical protein